MWIPFGKPEAIAQMVGGSEAADLVGSVKFYRMRNNVLVVANIFGLPDSETGVFALHIHQGSSCAGTGFSDTGSHFNPENLPHPRHAGDLPPLFSCSGKAFLAVLTDRFGIEDIIGRTVVIHDRPDDFTTQPSGNAGEKIGCGIIVPG